MSKTVDILGGQAEYYLNHTCKTIDKQLIHIPGPDIVDKVWINSDRNIRTLESLQTLYGHGRLANTGYVSILPVDQGIEHSAGASFAPNPLYFDPENIVKLAIEGGCNAVASTFGVLGAVARKYAHKIPFIVKLNHNELLTYPNSYDQVMFGTIKEAWNMGAIAVGATIYFGSEQSRRQIVEVSQAFEYAHELGMATILWCYLRNSGFKKDGTDYHAAADLTGQNGEQESIRSTGTASQSGYVGVDAATQTALTHAGVQQSQLDYLEADYDYEDGRMVYEVEFGVSGVEYEYDIDAATGAIIKAEQEGQTIQTPAPGQTQQPQGGSSGTISSQEARDIALSNAGVALSDTRELEVELEADDGCYKVEFKSGRYEYEYEISVTDGRILSAERDD